MSIVLNTELCWPLAAVGPNNAVVELFEHAGRGVGDNVSNPAKLPAILLPAHVHAAANQAVITPASGSRCHGSVAFQHCCLRFARVTPSSFSRGTVPRAMPSPNFELTTVEPALSTCPSASVSGWPRWRLQGCHARGAALGTKERRVCSRAEGGAATITDYRLLFPITDYR